MIGAMASKKARESSPVSLSMAWASEVAVRGPVAIIVLPQSLGGRPLTSPYCTVTSGCWRRIVLTASENSFRSTASAPPAGSFVISPIPIINEFERRISSCSTPTALPVLSSERKEFEHTSSANPPVSCASVMRLGRISCRMTGTPRDTHCQAASDPARPAPIM